MPLSSFIGGIGASRESRVARGGMWVMAGFVRIRWAVVRSMDAARRGETGQQRQARAQAGRAHSSWGGTSGAQPCCQLNRQPGPAVFACTPAHHTHTNWERLGTPLIAVHNAERCSPVPTVGSMDQPPHTPRGSSHRGTLFVTAGVGIIIIIIIIVVVARPITNKRIISACLPLLPFCSVRDGGCPLTPVPPKSSHAIHLTEYLHATPRFSHCPPPDTQGSRRRTQPRRSASAAIPGSVTSKNQNELDFPRFANLSARHPSLPPISGADMAARRRGDSPQALGENRWAKQTRVSVVAVESSSGRLAGPLINIRRRRRQRKAPPWTVHDLRNDRQPLNCPRSGANGGQHRDTVGLAGQTRSASSPGAAAAPAAVAVHQASPPLGTEVECAVVQKPGLPRALLMRRESVQKREAVVSSLRFSQRLAEATVPRFPSLDDDTALVSRLIHSSTSSAVQEPHRTADSLTTTTTDKGARHRLLLQARGTERSQLANRRPPSPRLRNHESKFPSDTRTTCASPTERPSFHHSFPLSAPFRHPRHLGPLRFPPVLVVVVDTRLRRSPLWYGFCTLISLSNRCIASLALVSPTPRAYCHLQTIFTRLSLSLSFSPTNKKRRKVVVVVAVNMFASALGLLVLAVSWALPMAALGSPIANTTGLSWTPAADHQTTCERPATFAADPSLEPANWRECAALYSSWATENGTFRLLPERQQAEKKLSGRDGDGVGSEYDADSFLVLLRETDCVLAVRPMDPAKAPFTVGDRDVNMLLEESLKNYSHGTELAVSGVVKCADAGGEKAGLMWQLAKTAK
ncbi:hypothetical protein PCL_02687 [Purpureocillium lilacinum]|uniref:Ecp2 effector protein-like domain-containing protein n=1 Tax=Purpureocillium lilacinum TaxID=33203 RepID=A0A2U3DZX4_PURLI|nr:hypothetical protein PCL_02687 [Purpureocillium lilacinum]